MALFALTLLETGFRRGGRLGLPANVLEPVLDFGTSEETHTLLAVTTTSLSVP